MTEIDKRRIDGRAPSRSESSLSKNHEKRIRGSSGSETATAALSQNGKSPQESTSRFNTMKKVAEEHRRKVREQREKQDEKIATQSKRSEELKTQIQTVLDELLIEMRKELFSAFENRLCEEKDLLKEEIRSSLFSENTDIAKEVEKKLTNGETFDARLSRIKNEFETNFKDIVEKQYTQIHEDIMSSLENRIEAEKYQWENNFKRDGIKRLRSAEEAVKTDFRVGLEDSQKQCSEIIASMEARTSSLEQKMTTKIGIVDTEAIAFVKESERQTCQIIHDKLNERDKMLRDLFNTEVNKLRSQVDRVNSDVSKIRSKICLIM